MTPKLHKDRKNVHPSSETNTEEEEYMVHVMAISITFIQIQKKPSFKKAEKYVIFSANMALILQSGSYLLRYSRAKGERSYSYNNHEKKVT